MKSDKYKVIIAGSRSFNDYTLLRDTCDELMATKANDVITVISGGSKGADALAERYAKEKGYPLEVFAAEWDRYGRSAGPLRNEKMACAADALIAFWDGISSGTHDMIIRARSKKLEAIIIYI